MMVVKKKTIEERWDLWVEKHMPLLLLLIAMIMHVSACSSPLAKRTAALPAVSGGSLPVTGETVSPMDVPAQKTVEAKAAVISQANIQTLSMASQAVMEGATGMSWGKEPALVAMTARDAVVFYDLQAKKQVSRLTQSAPSMLTASFDGSRYAWTGKKKNLHLWDVASQAESVALEDNTTDITGLAFSQDSSELAVATYDHGLKLWDVSSQKVKISYELSYWLTDLAYSPDGDLIAGVDRQNLTVHVLRRETGEEVRSLQWTESASQSITGVTFSPDWKEIAWVARNSVQLMDAESGKLGVTMLHEDAVSGIAWSPDGGLIATIAAATLNGKFSPAIYLWDAASGDLVRTIARDLPLAAITFSPDGQRLGTLDTAGRFIVWTIK